MERKVEKVENGDILQTSQPTLQNAQYNTDMQATTHQFKFCILARHLSITNLCCLYEQQ